MEEVFQYLKALEVNFLATRNDEGVSCRPFGDPVSRVPERKFAIAMGRC